ncbi:MAG TPA: XapX domain-containing protein [Gammaproteobacteria bacterium]|nr:XapX domain-containing protein [Gammaproteobacteria bacterium]
MKIVLGIILAFSIGAICRLSGIPVPAPPVIVGALLVVAMTVGYILVDHFSGHRPNKNRKHCGGPTGESTANER